MSFAVPAHPFTGWASGGSRQSVTRMPRPPGVVRVVVVVVIVANGFGMGAI